MTTTGDASHLQIKIYIDSWSPLQKYAIARLIDEALNEVAVFHSEWAVPWRDYAIRYLKIPNDSTGPRSLNTEEAVKILTDGKDIRVEVLVDFLVVSLALDPNDTSAAHMVYDARARRFLLAITRVMRLSAADLLAVEHSIAQQMNFALREQSGTQDDRLTVMDQSAKKVITETNGKRKHLRWLATGAGVIGGGALIALTGGLAAPLLAPLLAGVTGAAFFATAGGVALVTSLFGLTGGGLAGYKMHRRMKGLDEFEFQQILNDLDLPPVPSLQCTICISGFLKESPDEFLTTWEHAFPKAKNNNDIYCLAYERKALLDLGHAFQKFLANQAIRYAGLEVAKRTALHAFFAAVSLPATLLKVADVIDNPWQIATDRSQKAGIVLADVLEKRVHGNRPCSLVAYSCGCLTVWYCLQELYQRKCKGIVDNVILMGAPISGEDTTSWSNIASVVSGRFINAYSENDWVLAFVHRLHSLDSEVAGLKPIKNIPCIENVKLDIEGHTSLPDILPEFLSTLGFA